MEQLNFELQCSLLQLLRTKNENMFIENPIVTATHYGGWLVVFDHHDQSTFVWAYSDNGIDWEQGQCIKSDPQHLLLAILIVDLFN